MGRKTLIFVLSGVLICFLAATVAHSYHQRHPYSKSTTFKLKTAHFKAVRLRQDQPFTSVVKVTCMQELGRPVGQVFPVTSHVYTLLELYSLQNKSPPLGLS